MFKIVLPIIALVGTTVVLARPHGAGDGASSQVGDGRDSLRAVAFLDAVRDANPVVCEMTIRSLHFNGWGGHGWEFDDSQPFVPDSATLEAVRWATGHLADPGIIPPLAAALRDSVPCVRRAAGVLLGRADHPDGLAALLGALDDNDQGVKEAAILGLGESSSNQAVAPVLRYLDNNSPRLRQLAA